MRLTIKHPALLAISVVVLAVIGLVMAVSADSPPSDGQLLTIPSEPLQEVSEDEAARAVAVLRESGAIARINGGQEWRVDYFTTARAGSTKIGVSMVLSWPEAVSSAGPWIAVICKDAIRVERAVLWHNLRAIDVIVALDDGRILAILPGAAEESDPVHGERGTVRSYPDADYQKGLEPLPVCPRDLQDD